MEVQGGELAKVGVRHVHIEGLGLVNVGPSVCCHIHQDSLLDLPHCLVQPLQALRQLQILPATKHCWKQERNCSVAYDCLNKEVSAVSFVQVKVYRSKKLRERVMTIL